MLGWCISVCTPQSQRAWDEAVGMGGRQAAGSGALAAPPPPILAVLRTYAAISPYIGDPQRQVGVTYRV